MRTSETITLHFDLSGHPEDREFALLAGGGMKHVLSSYADAPGKREEHQAANAALALIGNEHIERITHFVEDAEITADHPSARRVVFASQDDHCLPEIAMLFVHIPTKHHEQHLLRSPATGDDADHVTMLAGYGVAPDAIAADHEAVRRDVQHVKTPRETAKAFVFHHPEIGSMNAIVAPEVLSNWIPQADGFGDLVTYFENNGPDSGTTWYQKSYSTWVNPKTGKEEPCPADDTRTYKDAKKVDWPVVNGTALIPQYTLSDEATHGDGGVMSVAAPVIQNVLKATKDSDKFNGQLWTSQPGTTQHLKTDVVPAPPKLAAEQALGGAAKSGFGLRNTTSSFGLTIYDDKLAFDATAKKLSFPVKNWPNRYLLAYVQFLDTAGTPILRTDIAGWHSGLSDTWQGVFDELGMDKLLQRSDSKNFLNWVSSGNSIFGVPVPQLTQDTQIEFLWPDSASKAKVLFGGLGVAEGFTDWDTDVCVGGVVATALMSFGMGGAMLALNVYVINPFIARQTDEVQLALTVIGGLIGLDGLLIGAVARDESWGKMLIAKTSSMFASALFGKIVSYITVEVLRSMLLETFGEVAAEATAEEILEGVPAVGWALRIAAVAADVIGLVATTVEVLASPSVYDLEVNRTMDLTVTVTPDPGAGTAQNANWPLVADHWVVQVKYPKSPAGSGGTTITHAGPMPAAHDASLVVTFAAIPAGGKIDIVAGVYSENDWLAGQWESGWISAVPGADNKLASAGSITQKLVPLTSTTTYTQKQRLSYSDAAKHHWQVTRFGIDASLAGTLDAATASPDLKAAFAANDNDLSAAVTITVTTQGSAWKLTDTTAGVAYQLDRKQLFSGDGTTFYEIEVQNLTNAAPTLPKVIQDCGQDGHGLCQLQNITYTNKEYMVGYAWQASGQNMPRDDASAPDNGQMYAFQAITALGQPQDQIVEPARGFTSPSFIAFNQFGLSPVMAVTDKAAGAVANTQAALDAGGPVPADLAKELQGWGVQLPAHCTVTVVGKGQAWTIAEPGKDPLLDARLQKDVLDTGTGPKLQSVINVYAWPVPSQDNFYLDSRAYTDANKQYFIRGVDFKPGQTTFDYDTTKAWGQFRGVTITDLAVHPHGYIVGVDYDNHKLLTLKLGASPVDTERAPLAMPLAGEGVREGLLNKPVALTVTADGRILVLEETNQRIQAFDVLGNPVPCFSVGQTPFKLDASLMASLDSRAGGIALVQALQRNVAPATAPLFAEHAGATPASAAALDSGSVDAALAKAFVDAGYAKADAQHKPPPFTVAVTTPGAAWLLTDTTTSAAYDVRPGDDVNGDPHLYVFRAFVLSIAVAAPGAHWLITDTANAMTFDVTKPATRQDLDAKRLVATMPLRTAGQPGVKHLDVAAETTGYIYTLTSSAGDGEHPDYALDVYTPDGTPLFEQQAVYAGKLAVDQWRSMFTLNYEKVLGPGQRTEPGVSEWEPSTPAGSAPTG